MGYISSDPPFLCRGSGNGCLLKEKENEVDGYRVLRMIKIKSYPLSDDQINDYLLRVGDLNTRISSESCFNNNHPLHVEIGCGNGHFLVARSQNYPQINFMGIDISRKRILKTIYKLAKINSPNVQTILGESKSLLEQAFADKSIDTCYLNFPDPWPKRKHHKNRLMKKDFLDLLHEKLTANGRFLAVSDHESYFLEILDLLENDNRFVNGLSTRYSNEFEAYEPSLFEEKWRQEGREIYYLKFIKNE
ncbi:MAG TPA: tRNA (guanosine(46)-N7)-methyltransferase TrmB [Spirochaetes bacterium]|nr:tRNA (guanosine(46)-N7)-methyltransferase TrmB [Spirochaetota bacterium]